MSRLEEYEKKCDEMKLQLAVSKERRQALEKQKEQYEKIISESCLELQEEANIAFVKLSERQRDIAKTKIEQLCTYAVQYIMGDNYESVIEIDVARSVPVANLFIKDKSTGLLSPLWKPRVAASSIFALLHSESSFAKYGRRKSMGLSSSTKRTNMFLRNTPLQFLSS